MHIRINDKVYKVYEKDKGYYIRKYTPQKVSNTGEFFELPKKTIKHIPCLKRSDAKLRKTIAELEALLKEEREKKLIHIPQNIADPFKYLMQRQQQQGQDAKSQKSFSENSSHIIETLQEEIDDLTYKLRIVETENGRLLTDNMNTLEINSYKTALTELTNECAENIEIYKNQLQTCHRDRDECKSQLEDVDVLMKENSKLNVTIETLRGKNKRTESYEEELIQDCTNYQKETVDLKSKVKKLEKELVNLEKELEILKKDYGELDSAYSDVYRKFLSLKQRLKQQRQQ